MEKRTSEIRKVELDAPVFHGVSFEPTVINFFFGRNGAGKSTVAQAIKTGAGVQWKAGRAAGDYNVLAYDQDFINDNFDNYEMDGVFTLHKANIEARERIDALGKEKDAIGMEMEQMTRALNEKREEQARLRSESQDRVMKRTEATRKRFELAMSGKKMKKTFCPEVKKHPPAWHDEGEIEELYAVAYDKNARSFGMLQTSSDITGKYDFSGMGLLGTSIVSASNTQFAKVMERIGNIDWVKEGHAKYARKANGICPFCQRGLDADFEEEIRKCFDEQYQDDVSAVAAFQAAYDGKAKELLRMFESNLRSDFPRADFSEYQVKLEALRAVIWANLLEIQRKVEKPALTVEIQDIDGLVAELDGLTEEINRQIQVNNDGVAQKKATKTQCDRMLWERLSFLAKEEWDGCKDREDALAASVRDLEEGLAKKRRSFLEKEAEIKKESQKTVNTEEAFQSINAMLLEHGLEGFSLRKKPGVKNRYEAVREKGEPVGKLSEGERNFLAFLYFYHLVKGSGRAGSAKDRTDGGDLAAADARDKIVVIDDPVSGMDSGALFAVGSMVRELIGICRDAAECPDQDRAAGRIRQIFILTHHASFHREVTFRQDAQYDCVSFFMIRKAGGQSTVTPCIEKAKGPFEEDRNVNPVQNAYTALWSEYKELNAPIPLLNAVRRILSCYFIELCGYQGQDVKELALKEHRAEFIAKKADGSIDDTDYRIANAMLSSLDQDCRLLDGPYLVQEGIEPERYRAVLKRIFEQTGHGRHYSMMCGDSFYAALRRERNMREGRAGR